MCATLDPHFGIDLWGFSFATCADVATAVRQAFDVWSVNHPLINFFDVTHECIAYAQTDLPSFANLSDTKPCPLAKIWLTTTKKSGQVFLLLPG